MQEEEETSGTFQFVLVTGALLATGSVLGFVLPRLCRESSSGSVSVEMSKNEVEMTYHEMS